MKPKPNKREFVNIVKGRAAESQRQREHDERYERLRRLAEHLEGAHNGDVVNIGWDGHRFYEIKEVE